MPEDLQRNVNLNNVKNIRTSVRKHFSLNFSEPSHMNNFLNSNRYFVFAFVRHPFDRLVSAYIDKIETKDKRKQFARM